MVLQNNPMPAQDAQTFPLHHWGHLLRLIQPQVLLLLLLRNQFHSNYGKKAVLRNGRQHILAYHEDLAGNPLRLLLIGAAIAGLAWRRRRDVLLELAACGTAAFLL